MNRQGTRLSISRDIAENIQNTYKSSNQEVIVKYRNILSSDLFVDVSNYPFKGNEAELAPECNFSSIVYEMMLQIVNLKEANHRLRVNIKKRST